MNKIYNYLFLFLFMAFISLPAIKHIISDDKLKSNENRNLTQLPKWTSSISQLKDYTSSLDSYLSDQFGFRKNFISGANKVKFGLFNEVLSKQITVGKDGFLFFNSHGASTPNVMLKSVCGVSALSNKFRQKTKRFFTGFVSHFRNLGIQTHIAIIPTKSRIYPKKLPEFERSWCENNEPTWRDSLISSFVANTIYYPLNKMRQLKQSVQVYLPSYFHWHGKLPNIIAEDIMKTLWNLEPLTAIDAKKVRVKSDLRLHLKGLHFYEDSYNYNYKQIGMTECKGIKCVEGIEKHFKRAMVHTYKKPHNDLKMVLITDSFGKYIAPHFIRGFSEVIHIDGNHLKPEEHVGLFQWIKDEVKPTHMLYLFHDGGIYGHTVRLEQLMKDIQKHNQ